MKSGSIENSSNRSVAGTTISSRSPIVGRSFRDRLSGLGLRLCRCLLSLGDQLCDVAVHDRRGRIPAERLDDVLATFLPEIATRTGRVVQPFERRGEGIDV